jgi:hypothetical protein
MSLIIKVFFMGHNEGFQDGSTCNSDVNRLYDRYGDSMIVIKWNISDL